MNEQIKKFEASYDKIRELLNIYRKNATNSNLARAFDDITEVLLELHSDIQEIIKIKERR